MRREVRIGAAIGVILIAVVVVGAIVSSRGKDKTKEPVVLDTGKNSPAGGSSTSGADRFPAPETPAPVKSDTAAPETPTPAPAIPRSEAAPPVAPRSTNWNVLLSEGHLDDGATVGRTPAPAPAVVVEPTPPALADAGLAGHTIPATPDRTPAPSPEPRTETPAPAPTPPAATTPPAPGDTPATTTPGKTHKIASGETFASLARSVYGDAKYTNEIVKANPSVDPKHLRPGMVISLPDPSTFKKTSKPAASASATETKPDSKSTDFPAINPKTEYRVQANDNLYKISSKLYHNANQVDAIYQLNKQTIGEDPAKLKLNMVLKLPEPPVATASGQ